MSAVYFSVVGGGGHIKREMWENIISCIYVNSVGVLIQVFSKFETFQKKINKYYQKNKVQNNFSMFF